MPSYKLGTSVKYDMKGHCSNILQRQHKLSLQGMPVTHEQFQASAIPIAKILATLQDLAKQGVQGSIQQSDFPVALLSSEFPGLKRDVLVHVTVPKPVFMARYPRASARHGRGTNPVIKSTDNPVVLTGSLFSEEQAEALTEWANNVVRVRRIMSMVKETVDEVLGHVTTTGHIVARWPVLAGLVEDKKWQTKLRMKPERLGACGWVPGTLSPDLLARMKACEPVLIMAQMLEAPKRIDGAIHVELWAYQSFESDRFNG